MAGQRSYCSSPFSWSSEAGSEKSYSLRRVFSGVLSWRLFSKSDSSSKNDDDSPPSPRAEVQNLLQSRREGESWRLPRPRKYSPRRSFRSRSLERLVSHPIKGGKQRWGPPEEALERTSSSTSDLSTTSKHSFAVMDKRQETKQQFSQFLDEVTFQVLDPQSLEAFRVSKVKTSSQAPRHYLEDLHSPDSAMRQKGTDRGQAGLQSEEEEKSLVIKRKRHQMFKYYGANPESPFLLENAVTPLCSMESAPAKQTTIFQDSSFQGDSKTSLYLPIPSASAADMEKISTLQEQKGELRKRLSYTTHKLEKLETEFDSTRHYLEIELRRAQEELEKVTEKLRRIQNNYLALQRINQELEDKLYRMGQHYEEEKRALSHEIVALNNHLLEAKVTIDKLSEDNELYRKDCNLAAQLLQCSKTYDRSHTVSELPSDFQERVSLHMEKHGCGLPAPLCHPSFADTIPTCVISQVLEKPEPSSLSSHLSNASARDLAFRDTAEKVGPRAQFKSDIYCSDTALYCPEERRRDRRPSMDMQVKDVGFLRSQHSTDSTAEEDGFHSSFSHEAFPEYVASLPTSSSYSSFSVTSEEKEHAQASTLTASQQAIYLNSRDELFNRQATAAYERPCSPCFATVQPQPHVELGPEGQATPPFVRTLSPYAGDPFRFPVTMEAQQALVAQKLRSESRGAHRSDEELPGRWRSLTVEDIGAYSYPEAGRISPHSFPEQYFSGSPGKKADSRASPIYPSYKTDSFSEGDDLSQSQLVDSCFLPEDSNMNLNISPGRPPDQLPAYAPSEAGSERLTVQMCGDGRVSPAPEGSPRLGGSSYANVSPASSAGSLEPSSMEASPEIHLACKDPGLHPSIHSKQPQFQRTPSTGLSRKDSLTKAQFYGTLLN